MKNTSKNSLRTRLPEALATLAIVGGSILAAAPTLAASTNVALTPANQFDQSTVTVNEGDTVTFTWQGGFHDVVFADGVSSGTPVGIDGTTFSRTFDAAGTYDYVCTVHQSVGMVGTIIVAAASAAETTTTGAAESTQTTAAPAAESTATTGGPAAAPRSGSSATTQPFTGPEGSLLPMVGLGLAVSGIAIRLRLRRTG